LYYLTFTVTSDIYMHLEEHSLHPHEPHSLYVSPDTVWVIISWRIRWAGHVAVSGMRKCVQNFGRRTWREDSARKN